MAIARAPDTRTTATAPRPGAVATATIVSAPPGSDATVGTRRYPRTGPRTAGAFCRSCAISHCCGSDARFWTK